MLVRLPHSKKTEGQHNRSQMLRNTPRKVNTMKMTVEISDPAEREIRRLRRESARYRWEAKNLRTELEALRAGSK